MTLESNVITDLADAVRAARESAPLQTDIRRVYADVDAASQSTGAACLGGGVCCRFDVMGHRLYLSTGELAILAMTPPVDVGRAQRQRCPYQAGSRCTARLNRPLGCRAHFCRASQPDACGDLYERAHRRIQELHEDHGVAYRYVELCSGLSQLVCF